MIDGEIRVYEAPMDLVNNPPKEGEVYIFHFVVGDKLDFSVEVEGGESRGYFFNLEDAMIFAKALKEKK